MIDIINISLQFNGKYILNNINSKINSGDRISLVGVNGSGKTSLLKIINGTLQSETGKIQKQKNLSIGYLPQENITHKNKSLIEEATSSLTNIVHLQEKEKEILESLNKNLTEEEHNDLINILGEIHHRLEELDYFSSSSNVEKILMGLGFLENDFERMTDEFSGGWQMRIALAKILITQNDILLMDEPTNHLDMDSLQWLISFLKNYKGSLLIVSHDKYFINSVLNKTFEIFNGKLNSFNGSFDEYLKFKKERDISLINQYNLQQKKIKETKKFIERFRYKATKAKQVQSRIKQLDKIELIELPDESSAINFKFADVPASGKINVELISVSKSFGEKVIFKNLNLKIERNDKIAFVGPNGAGKSTLAKIIANNISSDSGKIITGHNTFISYYSQDVTEELNPELDLIESIEYMDNDKTLGQLRGLLGSFLFSGDDVFKKVQVLSGGEKSRLALIKILLSKSNFLILDEPTNHLDMSSKEHLQKALLNFNGTIVIVSHDVEFLRPIVSKIFEIRKQDVKIYSGGIDYYFEKKNEELFENEQSKNVDNLEKQNRNEKKRLQAELRNQKYKSTKVLVEKINKVEKEIEFLENKFKEVEIELTEEKVYSNPSLTKQKVSEYNELKNKINSYSIEWENLNNELTKIKSLYE